MTLLSLPLRGGINETLSEQDLPPGELVTALNVSYDPDGLYGTRFGYHRLGASASIAHARKLASAGDELVCVSADHITTNGARLWSYDSAGDTWNNPCRVPDVGVTRQPLLSTTSTFKHSDHNYCGNYLVVAWVEADERPRAAIYDKNTGAMVVAPVLLTSSSNNTKVVKVVCSATEAVVCWFENGTPTLKASRCAIGSGGTTWSAAATVDSSVGGGTFSACTMSDDTDSFMLFYITNANTVRGRRLAFSDLSSEATAVLTGVFAGTAQAIDVCQRGSSTSLFVVLGTDPGGASPGIYVWHTTSTAATTAFYDTFSFPNTTAWGMVTIEVGSAATRGVVCATQNMSTDSDVASQRTSYQSFNTLLGGPVGALRTVYHASLASSPLYVGGRLFVLLRNSNMYLSFPTYVQQGSYHLVDLETSDTATTGLVPRYVACIAPRQANQAAPIVGTPPFTARTLATSGNLPYAYTIGVHITRAVRGRSGLDLVTCDSLSDYWIPTSNLGRTLYFSSHYYDGQRVAESGFAYWPTINAISTIAGSIPAGTYRYRATYSRINAKGEQEESGPSDEFSITTAGAFAHRLVIRALGLSSKNQAPAAATNQTTPIYINLYRTKITTSGDTLFYRVNSEPVSSTYAFAPADQYITIDDTATDATISDGTHPILYTDSGELRHVIPEHFIHSCVHRDRIWGIGADQRTVWFTQVASEGLVPAFADRQTFAIDDPGEPLVGLESLYDKLVIFSKHTAYVVFGDGPSIAGTGSDLTSPQRLSSSGGCVSPRSIVRTPMGVAYRSERGFELIGPDLSVTFLGEAVERSLASWPITTSAVHCPNSSTIRWTVMDQVTVNQTATGATFVYDYHRKRWAIYSMAINGNRTANTYGAPHLSATYNNDFGYVNCHYDTANAFVCREKSTSDAEPWTERDGSFIPRTIKTGWIKSAGDLGWQRINRVAIEGTYYAPHKITATLNYNYVSTADAQAWNTSVDTIAGSAGSHEVVRKRPAAGYGRCTAVQLQIDIWKDTSNTIANGRSVDIQSIAFDIQPKKSLFPSFGTGAKK